MKQNKKANKNKVKRPAAPFVTLTVPADIALYILKLVALADPSGVFMPGAKQQIQRQLQNQLKR